MLTEVDISNDDHLIVPGSYVQVTLDVRIPPLLEVPAEALVTRNDKPAVAVLDDSGHVHYKPVVVASDDGQVVRLVSGVDANTRVALDLGSSVQDGGPVQVVEAKPGRRSRPGALNAGRQAASVTALRARARGARGCPPRRSGRRRECRSSTGCGRGR